MSESRKWNPYTFAGYLGLVIAAGLSLGLVRQPQNPPVESLMPQNSILYVSWDGNDAHREAWEKTAAHDALYKSGCVEFLTKLSSVFAANAPPEVTGLIKDQIDVLSNRGVSLAIALPAEPGPPLPYGVLVLHNAADLAPRLSRFVENASRHELEWDFMEVNSRKIRFANLPKTPGVQIGWWTEGNHLVITAGLNPFNSATAVLSGQIPNVTDNPLWKKYRNDSALDLEMTTIGWLDIGSLGKTFSQVPLPLPGPGATPIQVKDVLETLGLQNVGAIVCRAGYQDRALRSETFLEAPAPRTGLLAFADQPAISLDDVPPLPVDSNGFFVTSLDWSGLYDKVVSLVRNMSQFGPPQAAAQVDGMIAQIPNLIGFDPKTDLCDPLGNVICVYNDPDHGLLGFGVGLAIQVNDADRLRSTVNRLLDRASAEARGKLRIDRTYKMGREVLMFTFDQKATIGAVSIDKDWLVVGLVPQTIEAFFMRLDGKLQSWEPDRLHQQALDVLPKKFNSLGITDPRRGYRALLGLAPFVFSAGQEPLRKVIRRHGTLEMPVTVADIPATERVVGPLFPNVVTCSVDEKGIRWTSRASLPTLPFLGDIGGGSGVATSGVLVALLLPAVQSARSAARRAQSANNMKQIALALHNYHETHGEFPVGTHPNQDLKPDKRLSWLTEILPFIEQAALYDSVDFGKAWDDPANAAPIRTRIQLLQNPGRVPSNDEYQPAHYVGIAGLGEDAPELPVTSKRAGAFGYDRKTRIRDILDGTSNTMGVTESNKDFGAWGAGGKATIRALTEKPYIDGPDGIGGPYPGGLNVMMLDGSVRFVSKNIDPSVLEAMSTIRGGEVVRDIPTHRR